MTSTHAVVVTIERKTSVSPSQDRPGPGTPTMIASPRHESATAIHPRVPGRSRRKRAPASARSGVPVPTRSDALATVVRASPSNCGRNVIGTHRSPDTAKRGRSRRRGSPRRRTSGSRTAAAIAKRHRTRCPIGSSSSATLASGNDAPQTAQATITAASAARSPIGREVTPPEAGAGDPATLARSCRRRRAVHASPGTLPAGPIGVVPSSSLIPRGSSTCPDRRRSAPPSASAAPPIASTMSPLTSSL